MLGSNPDADLTSLVKYDDRRKKVMEDLTAAGIQTRYPPWRMKETRDKLIARAKVCLNMHYYEDAPTEWFRLSHLLANGKVVVSEGKTLYENVVEICKALLLDWDKREDLTGVVFWAL